MVELAGCAKARAAISRDGTDFKVAARPVGIAAQPVHGDFHVDALVEGALPEVLEGDVREGGIGADLPAVGELARQTRRRAPVAREVAAGVYFQVEHAARVEVGTNVAGCRLIVLQVEAHLVIALSDAVQVEAQREGGIHRHVEQLPADARPEGFQ